MTANDDLELYDLERFLFHNVSRRFKANEEINAFDFFCIIIWKANRAKTYIAEKLQKTGGQDLEGAVKLLVSQLRKPSDSKEKMRVLFVDWEFGLPMASAILTVFYPKEFTIYDTRVCESFPKSPEFSKLSNKTNFDKMWSGYSEFLEAVKEKVDGEKELRNKDRILWARSFREQLYKNIDEWQKLPADSTSLSNP